MTGIPFLALDPRAFPPARPLSVPELVRRAPLDGLGRAIDAAHAAGDHARRDLLCARWRDACGLESLPGLISLSHKATP